MGFMDYKNSGDLMTRRQRALHEAKCQRSGYRAKTHGDRGFETSSCAVTIVMGLCTLAALGLTVHLYVPYV